MSIKNIALASMLAAVLAYSPAIARATANTKIDLVQDVASGGVGIADMLGPTGFGFLNYNQNADGSLRFVISLKNAEPNTTYKGVFLVGGPTHALATGYIDIGELTTNAQGNGNVTMWLDAETLQSLTPGTGLRTDHFDLMKDVGDFSAGVYAATTIDYEVK